MSSQGSINNNKTQLDNGTHIMVAGIVWQMFSMTVFVTLVIIFVVRAARANVKIPKKLQVSSGVAFIRSLNAIIMLCS